MAVLIALSIVRAEAELSLASVFGDRMVLQRGKPIRIWGRARKGAEVIVQLGDGYPATVTASSAGKWQVSLRPLPAGGPHRLTVRSSEESLHCDDVLVGEVWLASGQSNMEWPLRESLAGAAAVDKATYPRIRLLQVPNTTAYNPGDRIEANWRVCTPESAADFSAVAYYFGLRIHQTTNIPIGLIDASYGGSRIEPWIDGGQLPALLQTLPSSSAALISRAEALKDSFQHHLGPMVEHWNGASRRIRKLEAEGLAAETIRVDDTEWPTLSVPLSWQEATRSSVNGLMWLRHRVDIPETWAGLDLALHLGPLDAADIVWYDDRLVARTGHFGKGQLAAANRRRIYGVPGKLVRSASVMLTIQKIRWIGFGLHYTPPPDSSYARGLWGTEGQSMYVVPVGQDHGQIALDGEWRYRHHTRLPTRPTGVHQLPSMLYNGMIHPLTPMSIRGVIWYQGEANVSDGADYGPKLAALIQSWRRAMRASDLRFYAVQIAPYRHNRPVHVPLLWEAQANVMRSIGHAGIVVSSDVGDLNDIHPRDKKTIGLRLASLALRDNHGFVDLVTSGPVLRAVEFVQKRAIVHFEHAQGLSTTDGKPPTHFELAGADSVYYPAESHIEGAAVVLRSRQVSEPRLVRHGWHEEAQPNLVNDAGWPTSPFRYPPEARVRGDE